MRQKKKLREKMRKKKKLCEKMRKQKLLQTEGYDWPAHLVGNEPSIRRCKKTTAGRYAGNAIDSIKLIYSYRSKTSRTVVKTLTFAVCKNVGVGNPDISLRIIS